MRLYDAARIADTVTASDAYTGDTFLCQFEPMSFSKIDGVSILKRQASIAPTVAIPTRGCITIEGQTYLVGHGAPDYWNGSVIRVTLILQGATGLAELNSIAAELAGTDPTEAYAALAFSKYQPDSDDSSRYQPQYQIFLAGSESAPADSLIKLGGAWYLVKESYISTSGLLVSLVNLIATPDFETITFSSQTYNPLTDAYTETTSSVKILRVKWSEHYKYLSIGSTQYERGDQQLFLLKATTPKPSDTLTLSDGVWKVLSVQDEGLLWTCHARRA